MCLNAILLYALGSVVVRVPTRSPTAQMALAWVAPAGCHSHHYAWEARHPEFHGFRAGRTCVVLPQPKLRKHECPTATGRPSCASCSGTPDGDGSDDTALEDTVYRTTLTRGVFLRHAATALAGAISVFGRPQAIFALDPQRDKNTALPPPPALLLPVQRIRVSFHFISYRRKIY